MNRLGSEGTGQYAGSPNTWNRRGQLSEERVLSPLQLLQVSRVRGGVHLLQHVVQLNLDGDHFTHHCPWLVFYYAFGSSGFRQNKTFKRLTEPPQNETLPLLRSD